MLQCENKTCIAPPAAHHWEILFGQSRFSQQQGVEPPACNFIVITKVFLTQSRQDSQEKESLKLGCVMNIELANIEYQIHFLNEDKVFWRGPPRKDSAVVQKFIWLFVRSPPKMQWKWMTRRQWSQHRFVPFAQVGDLEFELERQLMRGHSNARRLLWINSVVNLRKHNGLLIR